MRDDIECAAKTPLLFVDNSALRKSLARMRALSEEAGCKVLLRPDSVPRFLLPCFAGFVDGTAAESLEDARLGQAHLSGAVHLAAAAYRMEDMADIAALCSHVSFLAAGQAKKHRALLEERGVLAGLLVTPGNLGEVCAMEGARLREAGISGLHLAFPAASALDGWKMLEEQGKAVLQAVRWLNFGQSFSLGGDEGRADYCVRALREIKKRTAALFIETGHEATRGAVHLLSTVLDVLPGSPPAAILDAEALPNPETVRPPVDGAGYPGEKPFNIRLRGITGGAFGDYSFDKALYPDQRLLLRDMAGYAALRERRGGVSLPFLLMDEDEREEKH